MKCPECIKQNLKSTVTPGRGLHTAMYNPPFYDEEGRYHNHDPNTLTMSYSCSNGHKWKTKTEEPCPVKDCEWNNRKGKHDTIT